jgi:Arc/MetJ-type ribon-helix-helix transcriptional regulator
MNKLKRTNVQLFKEDVDLLKTHLKQTPYGNMSAFLRYQVTKLANECRKHLEE